MTDEQKAALAWANGHVADGLLTDRRGQHCDQCGLSIEKLQALLSLLPTDLVISTGIPTGESTG